MKSGLKTAATAAAAVLALQGCSAGDPEPGTANGFPRTVENCGHEVNIEREPERVVALGPSEVTSLYAAGDAPKLVGRDDAGMKSAPYTADIRTAVARVPQLGSGGEISREDLVASSPDLVVGSVTETITPDTLGAVGIPMVSLRGNCGSNHAPGASDGTSDFNDVFSDLELFGQLSGTTDHASAVIVSMRQRIAQAKASASLQGKTAATVIGLHDGLEAYGRRSMAHTQFRELGAKDAFADVDSRVFEANIEELAKRNPDIVMILSYGETDEQAKSKFLSIPGAANLAAVRNHTLFVQPYEYSSQGTLSVNGLENMARTLAKPH
ncbi:ABC transporter substrate-binding protein [Amycolatopsis ultiminotia]|uniref:ABC transporter substrate-binding protein n=1 Tax=Amycolatopsis ultiminotia TaxID=543629 RepID=UPI0031EF11DA